MNKLSKIRILMLEIRDRIDVPVTINESEVKSLYLNLITENYKTIRIVHGQEFMNALIDIYAEVELYETCADMHRDCEHVNELEESLFPDGPLSPE